MNVFSSRSYDYRVAVGHLGYSCQDLGLQDLGKDTYQMVGTGSSRRNECDCAPRIEAANADTCIGWDVLVAWCLWCTGCHVGFDKILGVAAA